MKVKVRKWDSGSHERSHATNEVEIEAEDVVHVLSVLKHQTPCQTVLTMKGKEAYDTMILLEYAPEVIQRLNSAGARLCAVMPPPPEITRWSVAKPE